MNFDDGALEFDAVIGRESWKQSISLMNNDIRGLTNNTNAGVASMEESLSHLKTLAAGVFSAAAAKEFIEEMINVRGEFQQIENAIETITGSTAIMNNLMGQWKELTLRSPFRLSEIAGSGKQLLAYGIDVKDVTKDIEMLGNIASGVSAPIGDIAYLFGTLKTQGRAYQQDINQFTNRGIPIIKALADTMGVAQDKVKGMVEAGSIGFPQVEAAMQKMTSAGGQFYNLIGKQADTLPGQINRLKHEFELMMNELGGKSEGVLSGVIGTMSDAIEHYEEIGKVIMEVVAVFGAYKAAVIAVDLAKKASLSTIGSVAAATTAESGAIARGIADKLADAETTLRAAAATKRLALAKADAAIASEAEVKASFQSAIQKEQEADANIQLAAAATAEAETAVAAAEAKLASLTMYSGAKDREIAQNEVNVAWETLLNKKAEEGIAIQEFKKASAIANIASDEAAIATKEKNIAVTTAENATKAESIAAENFDTIATTSNSAAKQLQIFITNKLAAAQKILNATMLTNPYVLAAIAVAALGVAIYEIATADDAATAAHKRLNEALEEQKKKTDEAKTKNSELISIIQNTTATIYEQIKAYDELKKANPSLQESFDQVKKISKEDLTIKLNAFIDDNSLKENEEKLTALKARIDALNNIRGKGALSQQQRELDIAIAQYGLLNDQIEHEKNLRAQAAQEAEWAKLSDSEKLKILKQQEAALLSQKNKIQDNEIAIKDAGKGFLYMQDIINGVTLAPIDIQIKNTQDKIKALAIVDPNEAKNKEHWQKLRDNAQKGLDDIDETSKDAYQQRDKYRAEIEKYDKELEFYEPKDKTTKVKKNHDNELNEYRRFAEKKKEILKQIADAENNIYAGPKSEHQQKLDDINKKYDDIIKDMKKQNADAKNKGKANKFDQGTFDRAENDRKKDITDLGYSENVAGLNKELEGRKKMWEDYENFKKQTDKATADALFASQTNGYKSYQDELLSRRNDLQSNYDNLPNGDDKKQKWANEVAPMLNVYGAQMEEQQKKQIADQQKNLETIFTDYKSHLQKKVDITKQFDDLIATAQNQADGAQTPGEKDMYTLYIAEIKKKKQAALDAQDQEISAETIAALKKEGIWNDMFANLDTLSKQSLQEYISNLQKRLDLEKKAGTLTVQDQKSIQEEIQKAQTKLSEKNPFSAAFNGFGEILKAKESLKSAQSELEKLEESGVTSGDAWVAAYKKVQDAAAGLNASTQSTTVGITKSLDIINASIDGLSSIGNALGLSDGGQQVLNSLKGITGGIGSIAKGLAPGGNPIDIISGSVGILTNAIGLFNTKDKKLEKQIKGYREQLNTLTAAYKQLQRQTESAVGTDVYASYDAQVKNIQEQIVKLGQMRDSESQKKKADQGKIDDYNNQIQDLKNQIEDVQKAAAQDLLQTDFKSLSTNLADAFTDAFSAGENSADAFKKTWAQMVTDMVKHSLQLKILEPIIKQATDAMTAYMDSHNNDITGFDFSQYEDKIKAAGVQFTDGLSAFSSYFQDLADTTSEDSLSGAIKGMSEDTANILAGQMNAIRINQADALNVAKANADIVKQTLVQLIAIEFNTRYIKQIYDIMKTPSANPLEAKGIIN